MDKLMLSVVMVLAILYFVPFAVYGLGAAWAGLKTPAGVSPQRFLLGVFVAKIGTALAFVLIFYLGQRSFAGQWQVYAGVWWLMFVIGEIGQVVGQGYGWKEALAGVISETLYLPLSAWLVDWMLAAESCPGCTQPF